MKKDLKKLRQARADKAKAGKTALDQLNALLDKDNATDAEKAQIETLEAQVDAHEKEVAELDKDIAAEEKKVRRATLFSSSSLSGGHALATVVNDTDPARTGGFANLTEFARSVYNLQVNGVRDPRFEAAATGYQQNQGSAGEGVLVPTEWREQIWGLVFDENESPRRL